MHMEHSIDPSKYPDIFGEPFKSLALVEVGKNPDESPRLLIFNRALSSVILVEDNLSLIHI